MLRTSVVATAILAGSFAALPAAGELLSSRPITIIIPFTPGASADTLQRIVAKKVTENTGQVLVVESWRSTRRCPTTRSKISGRSR
jgi:tripartite-type tricarboxylate transporter receptor subunit TctC